jgi:methionyl aminopeptidase
MRPAGKFVAEVLQATAELADTGINLLEIDELARKMIEKRGAVSCYVDYAPSFGDGPFAHYICTSVNDAVLHGQPYDYVLEDGDLLSLDFACSVDGWVADSAISLVVGRERTDASILEELDKLMLDTKTALGVGIDAANSAQKIGDISYAIGKYCKSLGYLVNTEYGGHGVGHTMHEDPSVPNDGRRKTGALIKPGLVIAVEPWLLETTDEIYTDDADGWTIRSEDGSYGAHFEHTIAFTNHGVEVLTSI